MTTPRSLARIAGLLYLLMACCAGFAEFYVRARIVVPGDATATADNIRASATLFRVGFVVDLVQATVFLLTAMALYLLLRHVHQLVAAAMVIFVAVSVAIQYLNLLNQYTALTIATGVDYRRAFGTTGSDALTLLFVEMQHNGFLMAQMFFGLWLLPLGYLVIKSGYFPKILGVLLITACFTYLADLFVRFLTPDFEGSIAPVVATIAAVAELAFMAWLVVRGARVPETDKQELAAARHPSGTL